MNQFLLPPANLKSGPNEVAERMMMIERLGGVLKYADVADRVFRSNLLMIDLNFPRVLTLQRIACEASKQCGRGKIPGVMPFTDFKSAVNSKMCIRDRSYAYSLQHIKTALERIRLFLEDLGVL